MFAIAAFYRFAPMPDPAAIRDALHGVARDAGLRGTVLVAPEGVNGTVAGPRAGVDALVAAIRALPGCAGVEVKWSEAVAPPFGKLRVRVKREIVTMGRPGLDPADVGTYVTPADWNAVVADPDTVVVDTRNAYEVRLGSFAGAEDPGTDSFRDFPAWYAANRDRLSGKRVAMFCTGGIRCEKSTAYLKDQGHWDVVHLRGGILAYLEQVPEADSLWHGGCFVFDDRVSVGHGLAVGDHVMCHACRMPLEASETAHPDYEAGVSCHRCIDRFTDDDRARFRERMRQIGLARARGETHLG